MPETPPSNPNLPAQTVDRFLALQDKEIDLKVRELEVHKFSEQNRHDYAKDLLKAQAEDQDKARDHQARLSKQGIWLIIIVLVICFGFIGFCLQTGNKDFAFEAMKYIGPFLAGGLGGYGLGFFKGSKKKDPTSSQQ